MEGAGLPLAGIELEFHSLQLFSTSFSYTLKADDPGSDCTKNLRVLDCCSRHCMLFVVLCFVYMLLSFESFC